MKLVDFCSVMSAAMILVSFYWGRLLASLAVDEKIDWFCVAVLLFVPAAASYFFCALGNHLKGLN